MRHSHNKWPDASDGLTGTDDDYGDVIGPLTDGDFAIPFDANDDTEFLFSFGICEKWLITTYDQFAYEKSGSSLYNATILSSHISDVPYTAEWYHREGVSEDPLISYSDHWDEYGRTILYGEDNWSGIDVYSGQYVNVWMRIEEYNQGLWCSLCFRAF